eukprot:7819967-Pyramimonas_sp.AAC.1
METQLTTRTPTTAFSPLGTLKQTAMVNAHPDYAAAHACYWAGNATMMPAAGPNSEAPHPCAAGAHPCGQEFCNPAAGVDQYACVASIPDNSVERS